MPSESNQQIYIYTTTYYLMLATHHTSHRRKATDTTWNVLSWSYPFTRLIYRFVQGLSYKNYNFYSRDQQTYTHYRLLLND